LSSSIYFGTGSRVYIRDMLMTVSRDWLAVIASALLILLVKLGIASGVPW